MPTIQITEVQKILVNLQRQKGTQYINSKDQGVLPNTIFILTSKRIILTFGSIWSPQFASVEFLLCDTGASELSPASVDLAAANSHPEYSHTATNNPILHH